MPAGPIAPTGATIEVSFLLDIQPGAESLRGWSYGVCHDYTAVQPISTSPGATTSIVRNGAPPDFEQVLYHGGDATNGGGVVHSVLICFAGCATLDPGIGFELLRAAYVLVGPNGTTTTLEYCDDAEVPPLSGSVLTILLGSGGSNIVPLQLPTTIQIEDVPFPDPDYVLHMSPGLYGSQGSTVEVAFLLDVLPAATTPLAGWSYGVCHDSDEVQPISAIEGSTTSAIQNGLAPDFQVVHVHAGDAMDSGGVEHGVVICFTGCATLGAGDDYELLRATYSLVGPVGTTATLHYCDDVQIPGVPPFATLLTLPSGGSLIPTQLPTSIEIVSTFIRGDVNASSELDIADAISLLQFQFTQGATPSCLDSGDVNDSGVIDISDPIFLLGYLFTSGSPPDSPFPLCGLDPSGDADGIPCSSSAACP